MPKGLAVVDLCRFSRRKLPVFRGFAVLGSDDGVTKKKREYRNKHSKMEIQYVLQQRGFDSPSIIRSAQQSYHKP